MDNLYIEPETAKGGGVKKVLPAIVLATSFYCSFLLFLGLVAGYFASKLYCKVFRIDEHSDKRIFIDINEKWKIHMHHWILGLIFLVLILVVNLFKLPIFFLGGVIGVIAHDIYDFNDWHKVLVKNEAR